MTILFYLCFIFNCLWPYVKMNEKFITAWNLHCLINLLRQKHWEEQISGTINFQSPLRFFVAFVTNSMAAFSRSVCSRCFLSLSVSGLHCNFGILSLPLYSCLYKSIVAVASPLCLVDGPAPAFGSIEKYVSHRRIGGHCNYYRWPARELTRSILSKMWSKWQ